MGEVKTQAKKQIDQVIWDEKGYKGGIMKLKVMSFNISCSDDPNGHSIAERSPRLQTIFKKYKPDLIGLQEYTPIWASHMNDMLSDEYEIFNKYRSESNLESTPILWRKDHF
jgi:endonuclease/exonuclease/phosphatase family metal-dependent hydrolase